MIWFLIIAAGLVADRLVKWWASGVLKQVVDIPVINGVFHLHYKPNFGAALSMFEGMRWILVGVTGLGIAFVFYLLLKRPFHSKLFLTGLALIASGGIGNWIDRIKYGYVVDMFYIKLINFPIFNVADLCITSGAILVILYLLKSPKEDKPRGKEA